MPAVPVTEAPIPETLLSVVILTIPLAVFLLLIFLLLKRRPAKSQRAEAPPGQPTASPTDAPQAFRAPFSTAEKRAPDAGVGSIKARISDAESREARTELAPLYLELARAEAAAGNETARMAALRSAAGHGALHGPLSTHAEVRLELAEVAYASGDLTSACEHWQIARTAYYEDGNADAHAGVEKRMRDNGCPTDWVLTDF